MLRPSSPPERGFTLVELMLAMAFIGVLLVAVATTTQHMMRLYNKGSTLREINTVARTVVRDLQQSVGGASPFAVGYYAPGAAQTPRVAVGLAQASQHNQHYYVAHNEHGQVVGGRLCTGTYSYVWNLRAAFADPGDLQPVANNATPKPGVQYIRMRGNRMQPVRFMRVEDSDYSLCKYSKSDNNGITVPVLYGKKYFNVFGEGETNLMLYKFTITAPQDDTVAKRSAQNKTTQPVTGAYYNIRLTIGTAMGDESITTQDARCKPPAQASTNQAEYCAINTLQFIARTGQGGL